MKADWNSYDIDIVKTTGTHSVYAVPVTTVNTMFHNIVFSNATSGIETVDTETASAAKEGVFNLAGQRLSAPRKGLNIINGRKVLVK